MPTRKILAHTGLLSSVLALMLFSSDRQRFATTPGGNQTADRMQIVQLARERPCAALTLLYLQSHSADALRGTFFLDEPPSPGMIAFLLKDQDSRALDLARQTNPYAGLRSFIAVNWYVEPLGEGSRIVSTAAQLVDAAGVPLTPTHLVERSTRLLLSGGSLRMLSAATDL